MVDRLCWIVLGLVHLVPALALFRPALIERLYAVERGSGTFLLLRHRAALFLVIVLVSAWATFAPKTRRLASVAVGISMVSFLILFWLGGSPAALRSIALADVVRLPFLTVAAWRAFAGS